MADIKFNRENIAGISGGTGDSFVDIEIADFDSDGDLDFAGTSYR